MLTLAESKQRIEKFQGMLGAKGIDGALFIFPIDVYYFTGTRQNSTLWIPASGEPVLMVRKSLSRARAESPVADLRPFPSSKEFAAVIPEGATKIGFTYDVAPAQQLAFYQKLLAGREFVDISPLNREIRSVKSEFELEQLRLRTLRIEALMSTVMSANSDRALLGLVADLVEDVVQRLSRFGGLAAPLFHLAHPFVHGTDGIARLALDAFDCIGNLLCRLGRSHCQSPNLICDHGKAPALLAGLGIAGDEEAARLRRRPEARSVVHVEGDGRAGPLGTGGAGQERQVDGG